MGGCATKPKDSDCHPDSLPSENLSPESTVKKVEGKAAAKVSFNPDLLNCITNWTSGIVSVGLDPCFSNRNLDVMPSYILIIRTQENANGGESHKEEPLVDLSEPNPETLNVGEVVSNESKTAIADLVSGMGEPSDAEHASDKQTEENLGAGQIEVADLVGKADTELPKSDVAGNEQLLNSQSSTEKGESPHGTA
ncbi:hypothetical protein HHK36_027343 [Tetracentron sinense]|uniref:Uncharacterized protein n=1 Tax=Tetracentron sinense TaxID=13715 RepID=A0A834YDX1_TETSI|nr:hypothetical protein HHK36_027343 [Tetracentron sinense]